MPIMKRMKLLFTLALPVFLCQNLQAQTSSRLVAQSYWTNNGLAYTAVDSSSYTYLSTSRGGDLTHAMEFDNSVFGTFDTGVYTPQVAVLQQFNIANQDSCNTTSIGGVLTSRTLYTYNSNGKVSTIISQSWTGSSWTPVTENVLSYNGSNQLQTNQHETWMSGGFVIDSAKTYYYTASSGLLSNELDNYLLSGLPIYTNEYSYTYDSASHLMLSETTSYSSSGTITGFAPLSMVQYFYDSSGDLTAVENENYDGSSSIFVGSTLHTYSNFNSAKMPQTDLLQNWDSTTSTGGSWDNIMQYTNTYNSYNQLTNKIGISWNAPTGIWEYAVGDPQYNYFYETYSNVTAVKTVTNTNGDANIYPVPAQSLLHLDINWNAAQSAMITINDVQGRVVKMWDAPSAAQYSTTISINDLASGVYFMLINGQQGEIVKQFTVSH